MGLGEKAPRATLDFETRSQVDLRKHGTWRYATSPTTEIMVAAFRLPHWTTGRTEIWHPEYPELGLPHQGGNFDALMEFFDWITSGGLVEAHNAWFERNIWRHISMPRYGWPEIALTQWRCSAAQAAAVSLPRGLDDALAAMQLALRKDASGAKVMMKMTKPRKPRKAEREAWAEQFGDMPMGVLYHENRHLLDQLFDYVRQDVLAEEGLSYVIPDLSPDELRMYWLDQELNDRGFQIDLEAVDAALYLLQEEAADLNAELLALTGGTVAKATQRKQLTEWLAGQGLALENTQAATLDELLDIPDWRDDDRTCNASDAAHRALQILRTLGRSSTSKYEAMRKFADLADGRVRGGLLYHGATTGRWTGAGVQPHNFPKGVLKGPKDAPKTEALDAFNVDVEALWDDLKLLDRPAIRAKYDASVLACLSHGLRSAIVAAPGHELFVADYASIEARVVLWLAGDEEALEVFRSGKDIYLYTAESIYKRPLTKADVAERQMGKQAVLGLGFQMGAPKFVDTVAKYGISIVEDNWCDICGEAAKSHKRANHVFACAEPADITAVAVVEAYREKYWRTKQLWGDQEAAAIAAVQTRRETEAGRITWFVERPFLYAELPSGRRLAYPFPQVSLQDTSWGSEKLTLSFMTVNPKTRQWVRQKTYGGMLVENITQAVARDLIASALARLSHTPIYKPVLSVHDEAIAEAVIGTGSVKEFEQLVAELPEWADSLPVAAEAWKGPRYRK